MKLTDLAIDGYGVCHNLRLGPFGNGLNVIFGETGSGKTTIRSFVRGVLFGFHGHTGTAEYTFPQTVPGHLNCEQHGHAFRLWRDGHHLSELQFQTVGGNPHPVAAPTLDSMVGNVSPTLFDHFYSLGFHDTRERIGRFVDALNINLGVPFGVDALRDETRYLAWKQRHDSWQSQLLAMRQRIETLNQERRQCQEEIDRAESRYNEDVGTLDAQITDLTSQINRISTAETESRLEEISREIDRLRDLLLSQETQVKYVSSPAVNDNYLSLYERLDEIENQLRRWRRVQSDIQSQRVRLRDEMLHWNELTIESDEHPYHTARSILVSLETKVDRAERRVREANHVQSATDVAQFTASMGELCASMREDIYGLCQELGRQYKHIRQKAAAAELKQLRRCYNEMGENTELLIKRRESLILEIRRVDPAGADAIVRADSNFCHCAQHEGYLAARRKYVGDPPIASPAPTIINVGRDTVIDRQRLEQLEREHVDLTRQHESAKARRLDLQNRKSELVLRRDQLLSSQPRQEWVARLAAVNAEINEATRQFNELSSQIESDSFVESPSNEILERAARFLGQMSLGELKQVWLDNHPPTLVARDRHGNTVSFDRLSRGQQDQVYLSLALAACQSLADQGMKAPVLLDDVVANVDSQRVEATIEVLKDVAAGGLQVLAFAKRNELTPATIGAAATVFELPMTTVSPQLPFTGPARESTYYPRGFDSTSYPFSKYPDEEERNQLSQLSNELLRHEPSTIPVVQTAPTPRFSVAESTPISSIDLVTQAEAARLAQLGVVALSHLLDLDPDQLQVSLLNAGFTPEQIDRYQSQAWLMICVPGMRETDVRLLNACGITEPEQLDTTHSGQLYERLNRYLETADGYRRLDYGLDRLNSWYRSLDSTRRVWRRESGYSRRARRMKNRDHSRYDRSRNGSPSRDERSDQRVSSLRNTNPDREDRQTRSERPRRRTRSGGFEPREPRIQSFAERKNSIRSTKKQPAKSVNPALKFYLDISDHVEAAPSIGPKTAERFEKAGVSTVGELLKQTAESIAKKLNYKRITADVVRLWQQQARLVCRVPNLRGHDAQLLAACGFTEPEDIAVMKPEDLFGVIGPFSDSKDGLKIIRSGKKPDLDEIRDWITWAGHTRSLQAA